jgi:hypothetical protein
VLSDSGPEYRVNTPGVGSPWRFTVKAAKELKGERFPGYIEPRFIYRMAQSENLLPFVLGERCTPIAIPAVRSNGIWTMYEAADIRRMGFVRTARRFDAVNKRLRQAGQGKMLQERIDERGKLRKQVFGDKGQLVVVGAGGKHICAAYLPVDEATDLVIDQTLYWQVINDANEAWYRVGMLNSHALTEAVTPFNPKGAFGERHIHALPYRLIPPYDPSNADQARIAELAQQVAESSRGLVTADAYLRNPERALHVRRSKLRAKLSKMPAFQEIEVLCAGILGTTAAFEQEA